MAESQPPSFTSTFLELYCNLREVLSSSLSVKESFKESWELCSCFLSVPSFASKSKLKNANTKEILASDRPRLAACYEVNKFASQTQRPSWNRCPERFRGASPPPSSSTPPPSGSSLHSAYSGSWRQSGQFQDCPVFKEKVMVE